MVLKYVIDASAIYEVTGKIWTPADYLLPLLTLKTSKFDALPFWLGVALVIWTLPFVWIGVSMTFRRAVDAGKSPWHSLLFFVPLVNYAVMLWLASVPSAGGNQAPLLRVHTVAAGRMRSALLGIAASIVIGPLLVAVVTLMMRSYGLTLFLATPFVLGGVTAYIHNHGHPRTGGETTIVVMLGLFIVGGTLLLFALEGLVCIVMAAPIAIVAAELGGIVGRYAAINTRAPPQSAAYMILILPTAAVVDRTSAAPPVHEVVTSIIIDAPAERVWENVIRFNEITAPPSLIFRLGIAYPMRARISGSGVGAVRHCEFSTGAFVEPITVWDSPRRLSFGVISQPPPLRELSPYRDVYAPHLDGYFTARRGEFRLIPLASGGTRLEGSTWFTLTMYPQVYWRPLAEWMLRKIHMRVLEQVRSESVAD